MMSSGHSKDAPENGGTSKAVSTNKNHNQRENVSTESRHDKIPHMSVTSDEVNYLIFRYMQESGFVHSAFTFSHECMIGRTGMRAADKTLPPGALLSFLQKGLQYVGVEETLRQQQDSQTKVGSNKKTNANTLASLTSIPPLDGSSASNGDFSLLSPVIISSITRRNPPIQLTVPPAAAAAAVRARLAHEANINQKLLQQQHLEEQPGILQPISTRQPVDNFSETIRASKETTVSMLEPVNNMNPLESSYSFPQSNSIAPLKEEYQSEKQQQKALGKRDKTIQKSKLFINGDGKLTQLKSISRPALSNGPELESSQPPTFETAEKSASNKRIASESKRSMKKQKTSKNGEPSMGSIKADNASSSVALPGVSLDLSTDEANELNLNQNKRDQKTAREIQSDLVGSTSENDHVAAPTSIGPANSYHQSGPLPEKLESIVVRNVKVKQGSKEDMSELEPFTFKGSNSTDEKANNSIRTSESRLLGKQEAKLGANDLEVSKSTDEQESNVVRSGKLVHLSKEEASDFNAIAPSDSMNDLYTANDDEILTLNSHSSEVFMCAWNPIFTNLIATGSGDASARIWEMSGKYASAGLKKSILLLHSIDSGDTRNKDVTTLEWSSDGTLLATGSYNGIARVWDRKGELVHTLRGHQGPIFSLKWNKRSNFLLSGSYDKTIIVWNVSTGTSNNYIQYQFKDHTAAVLDVDWKDNSTFASCSTDRTVHIYHVNRNSAIKSYTRHNDEVNAVKWDYSGKLVASCSDDCTAKVWEVDSDRSAPLHDFVSHNEEIYTVKWSPTGPGSPHPDKIPLLATASFDGSIRLWNVQDGSCFRFFDLHQKSVYSVSFSPSGDYLASGSLEGQMYIWNIAEDKFVKSYKGKGDIYEVAWNKEETRVAACFSSNVVAVIDFDPSKIPH